MCLPQHLNFTVHSTDDAHSEAPGISFCSSKAQRAQFDGKLEMQYDAGWVDESYSIRVWVAWQPTYQFTSHPSPIRWIWSCASSFLTFVLCLAYKKIWLPLLFSLKIIVWSNVPHPHALRLFYRSFAILNCTSCVLLKHFQPSSANFILCKLKRGFRSKIKGPVHTHIFIHMPSSESWFGVLLWHTATTPYRFPSQP